MKILDPKVSIIIPVYNVEKYLEKCLNGLLNQTFNKFEIICVDDGSIDDSAEILRSYSERDDRFRIITQSNQGVSTARNMGMKAARGEYLYFHDSDDYIEENTLEILYAQSVLNQLEILYFNGRLEFEKEELEKKFQSYSQRFNRKQAYPYISSGKEMFTLMYQNNDFRPNLPLQFLRKDFVYKNELTFLVKVNCEDVLFSFSSILKANRVTHIDHSFYHRLIREHSIITSENKDNKVTLDRMICYARMLQVVMDLNFSDEEAEAITAYLKRFQNKTISEYQVLTQEEKNRLQEKLTIPEKIIINTLLQK